MPTNLVLREDLAITCIGCLLQQGERQQHCSLKDQADEDPLQATASRVPNKMSEISHVTSPKGHHKAYMAVVALLDIGDERMMAPQLCCYLIFNCQRQETVFADQRRCLLIQRGYSVLYFPLSRLQRGGKPRLPYTEIYSEFPLRANRSWLI